MVTLGRIVAVVYILSIFTGGYLAVSTLRGIWSEASRFERLASLTAQQSEEAVVLDQLTPAAGD